MDLQGRHALVTGGGRGIGRAIAKALSAAGAGVTVFGRGESALQDAVANGDAAAYALADVTDVDAVKTGVERAVAARGPVDLLIANAGSVRSAPFAKLSPDHFREMFEVHVLGMVHPVQAVLGGMIERGFGRIVAVASIAGLKAYPATASYATAKHAMVGLVRSIALETAKSGVTVNAVCPGFVDTEMLRGAIARLAERGMSREAAVGHFASNVPVGRLVQPEEVAEAVLYFCSPRAAATTGATLVIGAEAA
jgi:NAD(P)-dependent dehydrogenase (short-subunit alcohol dehydrogenase family)